MAKKKRFPFKIYIVFGSIQKVLEIKNIKTVFNNKHKYFLRRLSCRQNGERFKMCENAWLKFKKVVMINTKTNDKLDFDPIEFWINFEYELNNAKAKYLKIREKELDKPLGIWEINWKFIADFYKDLKNNFNNYADSNWKIVKIKGNKMK